MMMNGFNQLINFLFIFFGMGIVFACKIIENIGVFDNIKLENMPGINVASGSENDIAGKFHKSTEKTVACTRYIEIIYDYKRIGTQTFQKSQMLCIADLVGIRITVTDEINIGYHIFQTAAVIKIQNVTVFAFVLFGISFGKLAFSYACKAVNKHLTVFGNSGM